MVSFLLEETAVCLIALHLPPPQAVAVPMRHAMLAHVLKSLRPHGEQEVV